MFDVHLPKLDGVGPSHLHSALFGSEGVDVAPCALLEEDLAESMRWLDDGGYVPFDA